jgi:hypothetical protein
MSPTTLLPLPCVRYKADQAQARLSTHRQEMAARARAHAERQEALRASKEAELMGMQEKLKLVRKRKMRAMELVWWGLFLEEKIHPCILLITPPPFPPT